MTAKIINILAFNIGWWACVLGAAHGQPLWGPILVLVLLGLHLFFTEAPERETKIILLAGLLGSMLDTLLAALGFLSFVGGWTVAWLSPLWMTALWMNFGATVNLAMSWLQNRHIPAALFGAIGGPLAYYAGASLGAIELQQPWSLAAVAAEWALAMPILFWLNRRFCTPSSSTFLLQEAGP